MRGYEHYSMSTMFESRNNLSGRPTLVRGAWGSRAPLGILFSGHGHRLECDRCFICNGLGTCTGGFDLVAGFPPAGLPLAVLRSY